MAKFKYNVNIYLTLLVVNILNLHLNNLRRCAGRDIGSTGKIGLEAAQVRLTLGPAAVLGQDHSLGRCTSTEVYCISYCLFIDQCRKL